jgi:hypothetical protein
LSKLFQKRRVPCNGDGRTAPDTSDVLLEYPGEFTVTFEATLVPETASDSSFKRPGRAVH